MGDPGVMTVRIPVATTADACATGGDGFDAAGLERALVSYDEAEAARVQPALSDVPAKAALGKGRTRWCLGRATGSAGMFQAAEADLLAVITEYEVGNRRIAELAAEAHANLALVYVAGAGSDANQRAAEGPEAAIELTRAEDRLGRFSGLLGTVLVDAGDREGAVAALTTALGLVEDPELRATYQGCSRPSRPSPAGDRAACLFRAKEDHHPWRHGPIREIDNGQFEDSFLSSSHYSPKRRLLHSQRDVPRDGEWGPGLLSRGVRL